MSVRLQRTPAVVAALALGAGLLCAQAPAGAACVLAKGDTAHGFQAQGGGEIYDGGSNLHWARCSIGQTWSQSQNACSGVPSELTWPQATAAAAQAGGSWRLPTNAELRTLLVSYCNSPATDTASFPSTVAGRYWTADANGAGGAWYVDFSQSGGNGAALAASLAAVRLVK